MDNTLYKSETDFVISNSKKGIMYLEAKTGQVKYEKGEWFYGSGIPMNHDGPFNQAAQNKWKLKQYIETQNLKELIRRCKMVHAVWLPSIGRDDFVGKQLTSEADFKIMLTGDPIQNLEDELSAIFDIELPNGVETSLTQ